MNIVKQLEKQITDGNTIVKENGDIVSLEKLQKVVLKEYNKDVKAGVINPMEKSFSEYFYDSVEEYLTVEEVLSFIEDILENIETEPKQVNSVE